MNRIVLAQIDTIAGDIEFNKNKIIECIDKAKREKADLIIFPAFVLTGYPFGDIIKRHKSIIDKQSEALKEIAARSENITAIVGYAEKNDNLIAVIQNKDIKTTQVFEIKGEKYGILAENTNEGLMKQKPDTVINCACQPSRYGSEHLKNDLFSSFAKKYSVNYIYVNKAGYSDNLSFEGTSRIYDKSGILTLRAKIFEEDFVVTDNLQGEINELPTGMEKPIKDDLLSGYEDDLSRTYKSIIFAIKQYFKKNGFNKAVLGLSGGLDSSVCAVLLVEALGSENVFGVSMPSKITTQESKSDAEILAKNLGINFLEVPLMQVLDNFKMTLNSAFNQINQAKFEKPTTIENLQARIRASILWSIANEYKGMIPIATSDKSEAYIGYATVNGDMSGGFAPIADVTKTKLFALARFLNRTSEKIPESILLKPPGAELKINPKTLKPVYAEEDNMPYEFLDEIIYLIENKHAGIEDLLLHNFLYEQKHKVTVEQKKEWIDKFFWKSKCAVYKWHILPPSVIIDSHSINSVEYHQPIISKIY